MSNYLKYTLALNLSMVLVFACGGKVDTGAQPGTGGGVAASGGQSNAGGSSSWTNGIAPLHTEGKYFKDPNGKTVILRGVSIADPTDVDNRNSALSANQVLDLLTNSARGYYARVVRVPIYPDIWLAAPDTYLEQHLQPLVDHAVKLGLYVILDWHEISDVAPVASRVKAFWDTMAPRFANYTNVLYEIFNEPMDMANPSWDTWKRIAQPWVDAIRQVAPNTVILIGGPYWSQQIGGAASSPFTGSNLAYVGHIYPISAPTLLTEYSQITEAAASQPVVITEWGYQTAPGEVYDGTQSSFGEPLKAYIEAHGLSWTAWCADTIWAPTMFDANWTLLTGSDQMGDFAMTWLKEKKDLDQPIHQ